MHVRSLAKRASPERRSPDGCAKLVACPPGHKARLEKACELVGLSVRTVERWRMNPNGDDARHGPKRRARNALSDVEVARVLAVMNAPEDAAVSPTQLVPKLADAGIYLASESTMYRLRFAGFGAALTSLE